MFCAQRSGRPIRLSLSSRHDRQIRLFVLARQIPRGGNNRRNRYRRQSLTGGGMSGAVGLTECRGFRRSVGKLPKLSPGVLAIYGGCQMGNIHRCSKLRARVLSIYAPSNSRNARIATMRRMICGRRWQDGWTCQRAECTCLCVHYLTHATIPGPQKKSTTIFGPRLVFNWAGKWLTQRRRARKGAEGRASWDRKSLEQSRGLVGFKLSRVNRD